MRINHITLHDFGIFDGTHKIDLQTEKPIILIGGMNGRGKTTILEAILLALYGKRSFMYTQSGQAFSEYLNQHINKISNDEFAYVLLDFSLTTDSGSENYSIERNWNSHTSHNGLNTIAKQNELHDSTLSNNWDLFIEEILPCAMTPFFFFNGEKISELASANYDAYIQQAIKAMLGINIIETAMNDVQYVYRNTKMVYNDDNISGILNEASIKVEEIDNSLKLLVEEVGLLDAKRIQTENKLKDAENAYLLVGGMLAKEQRNLIEQKAHLDTELERTNRKIIDVVGGDLPLLMVLPLLKRICNETVIENKQRSVQAAIEQLPELFQSYHQEHLSSIDVDQFIKFVQSTTTKSKIIYDLTAAGYHKLSMLCSDGLHEQAQSVQRALEERKRIEAEMGKIDKYLSIEVNQEKVEEARAEVLRLTSELAMIRERLRSAKEKRDVCNIQYDEARRQQSRIIENAVSAMENDDEAKRIARYSNHTLIVLQEYKKRIQAQKTAQLAITMHSCFQKLASKTNLFIKIEIDSETLGFSYYDANTKLINPGTFSAGEKQILVIAMLWAISICSQKNFPLIVDTPLARLDSKHRRSLIMNYFPKASEQTILLSTDEEVNEELYQSLSPFIGKEYSLLYDDDTKTTEIINGYLGGQNR